MAQLPRKALKLFGQDGATSDFGQVGSLAGGNAVFTKDIALIQALSAYLGGLGDVVINNNRPALEDVNSLLYLFAYQLCYQFQAGMPEWDAETTYYLNSFVQVDGVLYRSLQNTNLNKDPEVEFTYWDMVGAHAPGEIIMLGGSTLPPRTLLCDGSSKLRSDYPRLSAYLAVDGYPFGAADASHFNVPPRGYFPFMRPTSGTGSVLGTPFGALDHVHAETVHGHSYSGTTSASNSNEAHAGPDNFQLALPGHGHTYSGTTGNNAPANTGAANPPGLPLNFGITY